MKFNGFIVKTLVITCIIGTLNADVSKEITDSSSSFNSENQPLEESKESGDQEALISNNVTLRADDMSNKPYPQYDNIPNIAMYGNVPKIPDPQYGNVPKIPAPQNDNIPNIADPQYGNVPKIPAPQNDNIPNIADPQYGNVPKIPDPQYGKVPKIPDPQYGKVPKIPDPQYGNKPNMPYPQYGKVPKMPFMQYGPMSRTPGGRPRYVNPHYLNGQIKVHAEAAEYHRKMYDKLTNLNYLIQAPARAERPGLGSRS